VVNNAPAPPQQQPQKEAPCDPDSEWIVNNTDVIEALRGAYNA
jgi:hypothetical protein